MQFRGYGLRSKIFHYTPSFGAYSTHYCLISADFGSALAFADLASRLNLAIRSPQPEKRLRGFDLNLRLSLRVSNFQIALLSSYNIYSIFSITDFSDM